MPDFVAPASFAPSVDRPPDGEGWCHEIKFDGYACNCGSRAGGHVEDRKGLDWTDKFKTIAKEAGALPDVLIDGENRRARS